MFRFVAAGNLRKVRRVAPHGPVASRNRAAAALLDLVVSLEVCLATFRSPARGFVILYWPSFSYPVRLAEAGTTRPG